MIITFFGHRNYSATESDEKRLTYLLEKTIGREDAFFYLGGYGNFDKFAFRCANNYKKSNPKAKLIFITPYLDKWLDFRKNELKKEYDEIIYPDLELVPKKFAIIKRNEWMIDKSDYVFAYVKAHYGGAYNSLLYAHKRKKPYLNLYQGDFELY